MGWQMGGQVGVAARACPATSECWCPHYPPLRLAVVGGGTAAHRSPTLLCKQFHAALPYLPMPYHERGRVVHHLVGNGVLNPLMQWGDQRVVVGVQHLGRAGGQLVTH